WHGPEWTGAGAEGDSVNVTLVGSAGIPMPQPPTVTESKTVDLSKSLYKEEETPKPPELPKEVKEIPQFEKEKPQPPTRKSRVFENKTPTPENAVPGPRSGAGTGRRRLCLSLRVVHRGGEETRPRELAAIYDRPGGSGGSHRTCSSP